MHAACLGMLPHCLKGVGGTPIGGVLLGNGSKPGDVLRDTAALTRAKTFFTKLGEPPYARFPYDTDGEAEAEAV